MQAEFVLQNGVVIPAVGYGSFLSTVEEGKDVISRALEAGYRYIDTASFYHNEEQIGEALAESGVDRDSIFLCSKVWPTMLGTAQTKESFEQSCEKLQTDHLDLFLIHWPKSGQSGNWFEAVAEAWKVMEELYHDGRVRAIGLSNFLPHHIKPLLEVATVRPMVDQLELHVGYMQEYTLAYLAQEGILPQAWSPLGRARLLQDTEVMKLAEKYGKSPAQILLRYLVERKIPMIPKASSLDRMKENLDIFDFALTWEEVSGLSCMSETGFSGEHPDRVEW